MTHPLFADDMKSTPYWWDDAPRPEIANQPLPKTTDVAIVGAGYTGLNAARVLARAGRSVVVLEAEDAAWGCSARNGGQIGSGVKPGVDDLERQFGPGGAHAVLQEGLNSLNFTVDLVKQEKIDCDFKQGSNLLMLANREYVEPVEQSC